MMIANATRRPLALASGRMIAPGEAAPIDPASPYDAALVAAGLVVAQLVAAPPPPPAPRVAAAAPVLRRSRGVESSPKGP